jgi:Zn-dependent protease
MASGSSGSSGNSGTTGTSGYKGVRRPTMGWRVGTIGGTPVFIAMSWLAFTPLVFFGAVVLVHRHPALGLSGAFVACLAFLVVEILSSLAHAAAHVFIATGSGCQVPSIVVGPGGGHGVSERSIGRPMTMALVALSGPATDAVLALVGSLALRAVPPDGVAYFSVYAVVIVNCFSLVVHLVPGLPYDGGLALESLVWGVTGRRRRALVVTGWWGRAVSTVVLLWLLSRTLVNPGWLGFLVTSWALAVALQLWQAGTRAIRTGSGRAPSPV